MSAHEFEILVPPPSAPVSEVSPRVQEQSSNLIEVAVRQGAGIDTIERLVALRERELARQAEIAFNAAMNRAQTAMGPVQADLTNPQTRSKYASYQALDRRVRPIYGEQGFSLSFDTADSPLAEHVRVVCYVSHMEGHTRTYHCDMPADGKGAKGGDVMTKTHAAGSAMSYGMRYLLKMIFNIAVGEDDDDGNGASNGELLEQLDWIASSRNLDELKRIFEDAFTKAKAAKSKGAMNALIAAKDKRKKELMPEVSA